MIEFLHIEKNNLGAFDEVFKTSKFFYGRSGWLKFIDQLNYDFEAFLIKKDESIIGNFFIEFHKRKFTKYGYLPSGVNLVSELSKTEEQDFFLAFGEFLKNKAREKNLWSIRFDYYGNLDLDNLGFDISLAAGLPKYSWEIDLTKSIEDLRHDMSSSTRNNINKGDKNGIEIVKADSSVHVADFFKLMKETTRRKGFFNFDLEYFKKQFDLLKGDLSDLYLVYYNNKAIAGAWINYSKSTAFYTHGASTSDHDAAKLRSPYPLQWRIMMDMKERGFEKYNMWGVLPQHLDQSDNSLKGVSDFKKSFGGDFYNSRGIFEIYSGFFPRLITRAYDWWIYRGDRY